MTQRFAKRRRRSGNDPPSFTRGKGPVSAPVTAGRSSGNRGDDHSPPPAAHGMNGPRTYASPPCLAHEVDPATGKTTIERMTACDDFGNVVNPMIVEGQVHGGLVQGIGQALLENTVYDKDGQLKSGSYMDYIMPRADDVPSFKVTTTTTACTHNPLGVKGCGEAGAIGSPPAVINAIVDALRGYGVEHIDMPATPEKICARSTR
ncbi:MAG: xanthine dehydrogenase family protein molybdopterin-binding subunit, partial [Tabrizicola sp.]|nr:xanthine dehydrogenase family protein molybdopterin-binding subunit [Tabrizicola sp.]